MWARQLAQTAGVTVANQAAEHYYLVTDAIPGVKADWYNTLGGLVFGVRFFLTVVLWYRTCCKRPVIEDPSSFTYIRPEGAGLMVGLFETTAAAWKVGSFMKSSTC